MAADQEVNQQIHLRLVAMATNEFFSLFDDQEVNQQIYLQLVAMAGELIYFSNR